MSAPSNADILKGLGWRVNTAKRRRQAVRDFQGAWALGTALRVDGVVGPRTRSALVLSHTRRKAGKPTASAHFSFIEFRCKCGGVYSSCRRIAGEGAVGQGGNVTRALIVSLEGLVRNVGHDFGIVSGHRCDGYNRRIGGATGSMHRFGAAVDLAGFASLRRVRASHLFAGIGYSRSTGRVLHVDRRDKVPARNNGGSLRNPMVWQYG